MVNYIKSSTFLEKDGRGVGNFIRVIFPLEN